MLHVSRATVTRWVKSGQLPARDKRPGRTGVYLFSYSVVARLAVELGARGRELIGKRER